METDFWFEVGTEAGTEGQQEQRDFNYFGISAERWHAHVEFRARVLSEFVKIPRYLSEGFLEEISGCSAYPQLRHEFNSSIR
jgi:hypothetical protein